MLEIKGKINTAICYAAVIEEEAKDQIRRMCDCKLTEDSKIRIMPDVHAGKGCTIGTTMTVKDKVCGSFGCQKEARVVGREAKCSSYRTGYTD